MRLGIQAKSDATRHRPGQGFRFVEGNFRRCICLFLSFISPLFYLFKYLLLFELSKWEEKNTYEKFLSLISGGFVKP